MRSVSVALALALCGIAFGQRGSNAVWVDTPSSPEVGKSFATVGTLLYEKATGGSVLKPSDGLTPELAAQRLRRLGYQARPLYDSVADQPVTEANTGKFPGYLEGYLMRMEDRAYPNLFPDPMQRARARAQRDRMLPVPKTFAGIGGPLGTWTLVGPTNMNPVASQYFGNGPITGRANGAAWARDNSAKFYIATAAGGAWKTTNGGSTWSFLSQSWPDLHCTSVAVDPNNSNVVYVGTGDFVGDQRGVLARGWGLMKSTDGGISWVTLGSVALAGRSISDIWINPDATNQILVATGNDGGGSIFRTADGGMSWAQVLATPTARITSIDSSVNRTTAPTRYLYAAGQGASGGMLLRSSNNGVSWSAIPRPTATSQTLVVAASRGFTDVLYVLCLSDQRIYKSTNAGSSWTNVTSNFPHGPGNYNWSQAGYDYFIGTSLTATASGVQDVVYVGLIDVAKSNNGGGTWVSIGGPTYAGSGSRIHNDQHGFALNPSSANDVLFLNDGGVYRYNNGTNVVTNLNRLLTITQFYHADWDNVLDGYAIGGTQDNSTPWLDTGVWKNVIGADGGGALINATNRAIMLGSWQGGVVRTNNSWATTLDVPMAWAGQPRTFIPFMTIDPNTTTRSYTGTDRLHKFNNFGTSVTPLNGPFSSGALRCAAVARGDSNRIYAGGQGQLYMTLDGGTSWTNITAGLPNRTIMGISVHPTNRNDILVVLSGSTTSHVWHCASTIASPRVWTQVSGTPGTATALPDISTNTIARDIWNPSSHWYVGTDLGVFLTKNAGQDWYNATAPLGLPNVPVTAMEVVSATKTLHIATFGRGMWKIGLEQDRFYIGSILISPYILYRFQPFTIQVTLLKPAPYPHVDVSLFGDGSVKIPRTLRIPYGEMTGVVRGETGDIQAEEKATITAMIDQTSKSASLTLRPPTLNSLEFLPVRVEGGDQTTGILEWQGIPLEGILIALNHGSKNVDMPGEVVFPGEGSSMTFPVYTKPVAEDEVVPVTATSNGVTVRGSFTIYAPQILKLSTDLTVYKPGSRGTATITLTGAAAPGGTLVKLSASPSAMVKMPTSVLVPEGRTSASVAFTCGVTESATRVILGGTTPRAYKYTYITIQP